jgi:hypothetical protein
LDEEERRGSPVHHLVYPALKGSLLCCVRFEGKGRRKERRIVRRKASHGGSYSGVLYGEQSKEAKKKKKWVAIYGAAVLFSA